jgi:hypothetical protein
VNPRHPAKLDAFLLLKKARNSGELKPILRASRLISHGFSPQISKNIPTICANFAFFCNSRNFLTVDVDGRGLL